jgi:hypothetical protein
MFILMEEFDGEPTPTAANNALYDTVYATMGFRERLQHQRQPVQLRVVASTDGAMTYQATAEIAARKSA